MEKQKARTRLEAKAKEERKLLAQRESLKQKIEKENKIVQTHTKLGRDHTTALAEIEKRLHLLQAERVQDICIVRGISLETLLARAEQSEKPDSEKDAAETTAEETWDCDTPVGQNSASEPETKSEAERNTVSEANDASEANRQSAPEVNSEPFDRFAKIRKMYGQ